MIICWLAPASVLLLFAQEGPKPEQQATPSAPSQHADTLGFAEVQAVTDWNLLANIAATNKDANVRYAAAGRIQEARILDQATFGWEDDGNMQAILTIREILTGMGVRAPVYIQLHSGPQGSQAYKEESSQNPRIVVATGEKSEISISDADGTLLWHYSSKTQFPNRVEKYPDRLYAPVDFQKMVHDLWTSKKSRDWLTAHGATGNANSSWKDLAHTGGCVAGVLRSPFGNCEAGTRVRPLRNHQ